MRARWMPVSSSRVKGSLVSCAEVRLPNIRANWRLTPPERKPSLIRGANRSIWSDELSSADLGQPACHTCNAQPALTQCRRLLDQALRRSHRATEIGLHRLHLTCPGLRLKTQAQQRGRDRDTDGNSDHDRCRRPPGVPHSQPSDWVSSTRAALALRQPPSMSNRVRTRRTPPTTRKRADSSLSFLCTSVAPQRAAFRQMESVGTRNWDPLATQGLACGQRCHRFTTHLAAGLGGRWDRYSSPCRGLSPLALRLAGLCRRTYSNPSPNNRSASASASR